jgi:hypothetical protein
LRNETQHNQTKPELHDVVFHNLEPKQIRLIVEFLASCSEAMISAAKRLAHPLIVFPQHKINNWHGSGSIENKA